MARYFEIYRAFDELFRRLGFDEKVRSNQQSNREYHDQASGC